MSITQNANRLRIESAAKNGTLGVQGALNADQIKFDTAITTNNSNLEASPSFQRRHVVIRRGETDEESSIVKSVDVDGLTCTMQAAWDSAPASGDTYDVAYRLEDCATFAGCTFESDSHQWVMSRRLIVGIGTTTFGFLGLSHGQVLRLEDRGPTETAFNVNSAGRLEIGTIKNDKANLGAILIFMNDADNEDVMDIVGSAVARIYETTFAAGLNHQGVNSLDVIVQATVDLDHARNNFYAIDAPKLKKRVERFQNFQAISYGTVGDMKLAPWYTGWLQSENDKVIKDEIAVMADAVKVRLLFEGE